MNYKSKKLLPLIPLFIGFVIYGLYYFYYGPKAEEIKNILINEYNKIPPPNETELINFRANHKLLIAFVDTEYQSDLEAEKIFNYYEDKLKKNEWVFCCTRNQKEGSEKIFKKGDYAAHIFVRTIKNDTNNYGFSIRWGSDGCEKCP